jgi:hypothetical protein
MDRWSMTNHGLTEEDIRDRDRWRNLVLGEGKPLQSGQTLDDDDEERGLRVPSIVVIVLFILKIV